MERTKNQQRILNYNRSGATHVESAHGRGVGRTPAGAADARQLARESAARALRITGRAQ